MSKKRAPKKPEPTIREQLDALLAAAGPVPAAALDDELYDACEMDARLAHEQICSESLRDQLEFLTYRGYSLQRLAELLAEAKKQS